MLSQNRVFIGSNIIDRGTFRFDQRDTHSLIQCDCPCEPGRVNPDVVYNKYEYGRILSFPRNSLPYSLEKIRDLSRYGFEWKYDSSRLGYVQCAFCGLVIRDFDPDKRAAMEHFKYNSACSLMCGDKTENVVRRNIIYVNQKEEREVKYDPYEIELLERLEKPFQTRVNDTFTLPKVVETLKSLYNNDLKMNREKSYPNHWIHAVPVEDLVTYGFKYCGEKDQVKCDSCGLEVKNWQLGDLAAVIHCKFSVFCPYMTCS